MAYKHSLSLLSAFVAISSVLCGTCQVGFNYQLRSQYTDNGQSLSIYDLTFSNTGSCAVVGAEVQIGNPSAEIVQSWNIELDPSNVTFSITGWASLAAGQSYTGAGLISTAAPELTLAFAPCDTSCATPQTCAQLACACYEVCIADGGLPRCEAVQSPSSCEPLATTTTASSSSSSDATVVASTTSASAASEATATASSELCSAVTFAQQITNSWGSGSQWVVEIQNVGAAVITNIVISTGSAPVESLWSMSALGNGQYSFPSYATPLPQAGLLEFGYTEDGLAGIQFQVVSMTCQ